MGDHLTFTASPVLSPRPAAGQQSAHLVADTGGKTSGRQEDFDIKSKREVGQKHFFLGRETSVNIRHRGSTLVVCKGESFGGKMSNTGPGRTSHSDRPTARSQNRLLPSSGAHLPDSNRAN